MLLGATLVKSIKPKLLCYPKNMIAEDFTFNLWFYSEHLSTDVRQQCCR